jgi:hypothetical protein
VTKRTSANLRASVHQRLLNKACQANRPFSELLQYYVMERFLYRLSKSAHSGKFILKGALMFTASGTMPMRFRIHRIQVGRIAFSRTDQGYPAASHTATKTPSAFRPYRRARWRWPPRSWPAGPGVPRSTTE